MNGPKAYLGKPAWVPPPPGRYPLGEVSGPPSHQTMSGSMGRGSMSAAHGHPYPHHYAAPAAAGAHPSMDPQFFDDGLHPSHSGGQHVADILAAQHEKEAEAEAARQKTHDEKHRVQFEKLFRVADRDSATYAMLCNMTAKRQSLVSFVDPGTLSDYCSYVYSLCASIAKIETNNNFVAVYKQPQFTYGGFETNSLAVELGFRMQHFGTIVYYNAAWQLNTQILTTFNEIPVKFDKRVTTNRKTDVNLTLPIFRQSSAQFGMLAKAYCNVKTLGGKYIGAAWMRSYVHSDKMTQAQSELTVRARPKNVETVALLCGVITDLVDLLVDINHRKKSKATFVYSAEDARKVVVAYRCIVYVHENFGEDAPSQRSDLMIEELTDIFYGLRNYVLAIHYEGRGLAKEALHFIRLVNPFQFTADRHRIVALAKSTEGNAYVTTLLQDTKQNAHPAKFTSEFPDGAYALESTFYTIAAKHDIPWPEFAIKPTKKKLIVPKRLTESAAAGSATTK